jgi:CDP-glycerol glycerophosphotransferase (TagB/SpsB family)
LFSGFDEKWFIESGYPRNSKLSKLFLEEQAVVDEIRKATVSILYAPTFRENGDVPHPLSEACLREFLAEHGYLWIEKPHSAAKNTVNIESLDGNILYLDKNFDINVILPEISLLVSDYSSTVYDAYAFDKPVIFYAPDYQHYMTNERGFVCDYKELVSGFEAMTVQELVNRLELSTSDSGYKQKLADKVRKEKDLTLCDNKEDMGEVFATIHKRLGVFSRK